MGYATKEQLFSPSNIADLGHGDGYALTQDRLMAL